MKSVADRIKIAAEFHLDVGGNFWDAKYRTKETLWNGVYPAWPMWIHIEPYNTTIGKQVVWNW